MFPEPPDRFWGYDVTAVQALAEKVKSAFDQLEDAATSPMMDFDDRDLVRLAENAGFERIHLECHVDIQPGSLTRAVSLEAFLGSSPNPLAPTVRESIVRALTLDEQQRFLAHLGHAIAGDNATHRSAVVYLSATKSGSRGPWPSSG